MSTQDAPLLHHLDIEGLHVTTWGSSDSVAPEASDIVLLSGAWDGRALLALKPTGVLIWASENPFSISAWAGAPSGSTGKIGESLCGNLTEPFKRALSRRECIEKLTAAGFGVFEEDLVFPTLSKATTILSREFAIAQPLTVARIASSALNPASQLPRLISFSEPLALLNASRAGLLPELAPGFLFIASRQPGGDIARKIARRIREGGELGWHYSLSRSIPAKTVFCRLPGSEKIRVKKEPFEEMELLPAPFSGEPAFDLRLLWDPPRDQELLDGKPVAEALSEVMYTREWKRFERLLRTYIQWSFEFWAVPGSSESAAISGKALDATFINAQEREGSFELFDLEWICEDGISRAWFVFRNCLVLARQFDLLSCGAPFENLRDLHATLCRSFQIEPEFEACLEKEAHFQALATDLPAPGEHATALRATFEHQLAPAIIPRDPELESEMRAHYPQLAGIGKSLVYRAIRKAGRLGGFRSR